MNDRQIIVICVAAGVIGIGAASFVLLRPRAQAVKSTTTAISPTTSATTRAVPVSPAEPIAATSTPAFAPAPSPTTSPKPPAEPSLMPLMLTMRLRMLGSGSRWYLWVQQVEDHDQALSSRAQLDRLHARPTTQPAADATLKRANLPRLERFLDDLGYPGGWSTGFLDDPAVEFVDNDGTTTLLVGTVCVTDVYNTLRLDAQARAAKAVARVVLPAMNDFARAFDAPGVEAVVFVAAYGSRDFSRDGSFGLEGEVVAVHATRSVCQQLADAVITDQEFLDRSEVYLCDRDSQSRIRKVKLQAE